MAVLSPEGVSGSVQTTARTTGLVLGVLARRRRLRRHDRWSRDRLLDHQARELARQRRHAYARSPFYQRFHAGRFDAPLSDLPVLTKDALMGHFDEIVTAPDVSLRAVEEYLAALRGDELFRGKYYVCATAGTTGRRGVFVWNVAEWIDILTSYNRVYEWGGAMASLTRPMTVAVVSSTNPSHQSARVGASIHSHWMRTLRIDSGDALASVVARLNAWQPGTLIAYASMLRLLAQEQLTGRLAVAPRFVFSASEVLTDSTRELSVRAWVRGPRNVYGATETAGIAAECDQHRGLHLFEDLVITEVVDENNQPVAPGMYGAKVLVTVLFSRILPLIRYELTDSVQPAVDHGCPCGRPYALLAGVQGREQEALRFPTGEGSERVVQPVVFHHVMDQVSAGGWQIVQRPDGLEVLLAPPHPVDGSTLARRLQAALTARGVVAPSVQVREVDVIPRTALGKAPLIVRVDR